MASGALEEWGAHCSLPTCNDLDFLPFKCQACHLLYCASHHRPLARPGENGHLCAQWDESKQDRRVPSCPLCGAPVSIPPGVDPNVPMDAHLTSSCPVLDPSTGFARSGAGSSAASSSSSLSHGGARPKKAPDVCAFGKCSTRMIVPMRCAGCGRDFCTPHRFAADHACKGKTLADAQPPTKAKVWDGKFDVRFINDPQKRAALSAVKRKLMSPNAPDAAKPALQGPAGTKRDPIVLGGAAPAPPKPSSDAKSTPHLPKLGLGKVDRRAKAEEESRRRALEMRARKGLLTEQEKVQYATELALLHGSSSKKDDCLVS